MNDALRPGAPEPALTRHAVEDALVADNARVLRQGIALLRALPEAEYAAEARFGSTVGAHFRHVLDHYLCLLDGLSGGLIHYEGRRRDPVVETERPVALALAAEVCERLFRLDPRLLAADVRVRCRSGALAEDVHGDHASSVYRELQFVLLHTVHHYAFIAGELRLRGYPVDAEFGVAPATLRYRKVSSEQA